jgi:hypothetical protein
MPGKGNGNGKGKNQNKNENKKPLPATRHNVIAADGQKVDCSKYHPGTRVSINAPEPSKLTTTGTSLADLLAYQVKGKKKGKK